MDPFDLDAEYKTSFVFPADVEPEHPEMTVRLTSAAEHVLKAVEVNPAYKDVKSVVVSSLDAVQWSSLECKLNDALCLQRSLPTEGPSLL